MDFLRDLWRKHRKKILVTVGFVGSGYLFYKLYNSHSLSLSHLERELAQERENEEIIKTQMKAHFENIQMIVDSTTLPHAMQYLTDRIMEEIDVSIVMDSLLRGKETLNPSLKLQLWDNLKILSFTRMVVFMWSVTMLSLYMKVQVNILGRHLYINTARDLDSSHLLEDLDVIDRDDEQKFLASADFLAANGMPRLISNIQGAVTEVLKGKQLKDVFTTSDLQDTVMRILDVFMSSESPHHWVDYLMTPQDVRLSRVDVKSSENLTEVSSSDITVTKFDQLVVETREVLTSAEFTEIAEISMRTVTEALIEEMEREGGLEKGMPLAKLIPKVEKTVAAMRGEAWNKRFIQLIRDLPQVKLFFTLLYSTMTQ